MKERFEMLWYTTALSLIPTSLLSLIYWAVDDRTNLTIFFIFITMIGLRWLVTGRHLSIPVGETKPANIIIGAFFFLSFVFWGLVIDSLN